MNYLFVFGINFFKITTGSKRRYYNLRRQPYSEPSRLSVRKGGTEECKKKLVRKIFMKQKLFY